MVELGGMPAAAILKMVTSRIDSVIRGEITLQDNFLKDLKKMKMILESIEAVLQYAESRSITDKSLHMGTKRLKEVMYAIWDIIGEFETETTQLSVQKFSLQKHVAVMIPCLPISPKNIRVKKMNQLRKDLEKITSQYRGFSSLAGTNANQMNVTDIRETSSYMGVEQIVGRTKEMDTILALFSESMKKQMLTILPIYGIGGLGKTTLAKMVYNSTQFKAYSRVWVHVSHTFDLKKIGNSIIAQLSEEQNESQYQDFQMIHNSLSKLLADKKILIVLDDLWESDKSHLDNLKAMLEAGKDNKVVVVVTTRDEDIAMKMCTIQPHKLAPLTNDMCWSIIKHKSDFKSRDDKKELKQIGKEIASKCRGVGLAAQSLGYVLQSMTPSQWKLVRDSGIWVISDLEDPSLTRVLASLRLSYSVMPSYLKLCFVYCAIFPKGHKIVKDDLIYQWASLGFIEPTVVSSSWKLGERYIRQLLGLSFLQDSNLPKIAEDSGSTLLTMHDLVHDLARFVLDDEILIPSEYENKEERFCRYALLNDCSKPLESSNIRALRFMDCSKIELHDAAFSSAMSLCVLDLSECFIHNLPDSIGLLKQLRYLNAPRVQHATLPDSITKLSKLIYLNLHGSSTILALPELIGELNSLMHLDLSGCLRIEELPESLGHLKKLVHLDLSNCCSVRDVSKILGSLRELQYLNLSGCLGIEELPESFGMLKKLLHLDLSNCSRLRDVSMISGSLKELQYLNFSSKLSYLEKLPEAMGSFINLRYLNLSGCHYLEEFPKLFENLKSLVHLDLSNCPKVNGVPKVLGGFTNLQYLNLSRTYHGLMPRLRGLPDVIGNLINLRYLNLSRCMSSIFETYSDCSSKFQIDTFMYRISTLSNLEHLELSGNDAICTVPQSLCNLKKEHAFDLSHWRNLKNICRISMAIPCFAVHARDGKSGSNLVLLQHMDPAELNITSLENVKSAEEAESIKLMEKKRLGDLTLEWRRDAERFVDDKVLLEKLAPPNTLKKLEISGCNSVSFPAWRMGQLPNLELLVLRGMESLEEWNMSYSSGEDYVIQELEIHDCPKLKMDQLPRAIKLKISSSDNLLSSWGERTISHNGASSSYSPVTTILHVEYCKVSLHQWRLLHHLPGLTSLSISHCDDLTSSPEIIPHLSSLEILAVAAQDQEELPEWLGELTSLRQLNIMRYSGATKLHDNMKQLTKLQSLNMYGCNRLASLPNWLGELTSLKTLYIFGCDGIMSLPKGIQQLCNLQELEIYNCPKLMHWVESEENEMNLTHNQERVCVLPTSLKKLVIWECHGIMSLPEGIEQLSDLQQLQIYLCPLLKRWCASEENLMKLAHVGEKNIF